MATVVDELSVIRSMTSTVNEHAQGNYFFHTGFPLVGHPSAGAYGTFGSTAKTTHASGSPAAGSRWSPSAARVFPGERLEHVRRQRTS